MAAAFAAAGVSRIDAWVVAQHRRVIYGCCSITFDPRSPGDMLRMPPGSVNISLIAGFSRGVSVCGAT